MEMNHFSKRSCRVPPVRAPICNNQWTGRLNCVGDCKDCEGHRRLGRLHKGHTRMHYIDGLSRSPLTSRRGSSGPSGGRVVCRLSVETPRTHYQPFLQRLNFILLTECCDETTNLHQEFNSLVMRCARPINRGLPSWPPYKPPLFGCSPSWCAICSDVIEWNPPPPPPIFPSSMQASIVE